jgi:general stress protein 26
MQTTPTQLNPEERQKVFTFLQAHPIGVLATVDERGDPHASAIYFSVTDSLHITFTTKHDTRKYQNIQRHSTVTLVVFEAASQTSVQISGKAVEVTDFMDQQKIYQGTLRATQQTGEDMVPPIAKIPAGNYVSFDIHSENIVLSEYGWGDSFAKALKHVKDPEDTSDPA